jgi:hypothetical protein
MIGEFVVPSVLGNAVGGVLLVTLLNYGQVAAEKEEGETGGPAHRAGPERSEGRTGAQAKVEKEEDEKVDLGAW